MWQAISTFRVGVVCKAAYSIVAVYYLAIDELLHWIFFLFGVLDMGFMVLFIAALLSMTNPPSAIDDKAST